jgi:hypothetical protein
MTDTTTLIDDYVAMWNEPDATTRRQRVRDLWAANGRQVLAPPQPILDLARPLGFRRRRGVLLPGAREPRSSRERGVDQLGNG